MQPKAIAKAKNYIFNTFSPPYMRALLTIALILGCYASLGSTGALAWLGMAVTAGCAILIAVPSLLSSSDPKQIDDLTGLTTRRGVISALNTWIRMGTTGQAQTAVVLTEIDNFKLTEEAHDRQIVEAVLNHVANQLRLHLREHDVAARLEGPVFAIALSPSTRISLESVLQLSARLQHAFAEPLEVGGTVIRISASIGFALEDRVRGQDGNAILQAATSALVEAQRSGPNAVRSYSDVMRERIITRNALCNDVGHALRSGQITAFFQPQICLATQEIAGFETLSRWHHPTKGIVSPAEFLPALKQAGLMEELGNLMVTCALDALLSWDEAGHNIPCVGVNFSTDELRSPYLVERIAMMLEARGIAPERLMIEVLETVVANSADDTVVRNLAGLADLGCGIDLDDFGTGYASITNIRRLSIGRIKIDRSFVTKIDSDQEQQDMVAAILTMAERLGLETLAEGVETPAERAMLAKLGCESAQGFLFARPMPLAETVDWIGAFKSASEVTIPFRRQAG